MNNFGKNTTNGKPYRYCVKVDNIIFFHGIISF
jgi:hypothetical protein